VRQIFAKHFQNLNLEPTRAKNHGHVEPEDLYHESVKIPNRPIQHIWKNNRVEMRVQNMANVIPICVAFVPNFLHHNNVGVNYEGTSNFKMELVRIIPLYFVAMLQFMVTIIKAPLVTTPTHIVVGMKSITQTPRGIELVGVHTEMPKEVNRVFA
jgi:hypothetical protein